MGSDTNEAHAVELLAHDYAKTTRRYYRRKTPVVTPLTRFILERMVFFGKRCAYYR